MGTISQIERERRDRSIQAAQYNTAEALVITPEQVLERFFFGFVWGATLSITPLALWWLFS